MFNNRKATEEHYELNIIEYPFLRKICFKYSNLDLNNFNKKILWDDKENNYNNEDDDSSFDSNIIYDDD